MSKRRRSIIAIVCILAAAASVVLDHSCVSQSINKPAQTAESQSSDLQKYDGRQFTVVKVVDGDTLDIDIPDANYTHTRIRLWGVDTPETKDPRTGPMYFGKEASDFATKLALGKQVTIYLDKNNSTRDPNARDKDPNARDKDPNAKDKDPNTRDKYHRLLAYVQLTEGIFLNEELLSEGYAYADLRFKHSLYNKYKQLESLARSQKKGLWAGVTPEQMPKWKQKREGLDPSTLRYEGQAAEVNN